VGPSSGGRVLPYRHLNSRVLHLQTLRAPAGFDAN
jgi:hypothetical protein